MTLISKITPTELHNLYINKQLSTYEIADLLNCDPKTVYYWLKKYNIKTRSVKKEPIQKKILIDLYENQKMSLKEIGLKYHMTPSGIFKRTKKYKINLRNSWDINTGIKKPFTGNLEEKAYMIGFRLGDLGVRESSPRTKMILIGTNTTKEEQIELVRNLFKKYSKVWISKPNKIGVMSFSTILHPSFSFLLPKIDTIENWIMANRHTTIAFIAGYIDAEGSFGIYNKRAKFRIGSYDKGILKQIHNWLRQNQIKSIFVLERKRKIGQNKDFWRITINDSKSLHVLYQLLHSSLRHKKRRKDFDKVVKNIFLRVKNGTIRI